MEVTNSGRTLCVTRSAIKDGSRWTRDILWSEDNHFRSATLNSTFSFAGLETLNIRVAMCCVMLAGRGDFHAARKTVAKHILGRFGYCEVRQSRQMLGAGVIPVEMTFLKPAP
ncbi:YjbF family lipoprotein [Escherichia coli]